MFQDRSDAGRQLAARLDHRKDDSPIVYALPRGGVPVAVPVAERLGAPLDLLMVRKLGLPHQPEVAAGAVVDGDSPQVVFNTRILQQAGLREADFDAMIAQKLDEIDLRRRRYMGSRTPLPATGRWAIVVDDGIATGATVRAALKALRAREPAGITLAVPVAPADTLDDLGRLVDEVICLETPAFFRAVGAHYTRFDQVGDDAVAAVMHKDPDTQDKPKGGTQP